MRVGVLASGMGTNLRALLQWQKRGDLSPAEVVCVLTNVSDAGALGCAEEYGIPSACIPHQDFTNREDFDRALIQSLRSRDVELVVLAGFMRVLSRVFVDEYAGAILNVHPSLLPAFPGLNAPTQAIEAGVSESGCTVHLVDYGVDTGPVLSQKSVPVFPEDTPTVLHERIKLAERELLPRTVQEVAANTHHT